jgi:hypothetical protein
MKSETANIVRASSDSQVESCIISAPLVPQMAGVDAAD